MAINFPANPSINDTFIVSGTIFTWSGVKWQSTAVTEISSDTSPQLGGTLDANSQNINNVNNLVVDGNLTVNGTTTTIDTAVTAVDSLQIDGSVAIGTATGETNFLTTINGDLSLGEKNGTDNTYIEQKQNGHFEIINSGRTADNGSVRINSSNSIGGDTTYFRDFIVYDGKGTALLTVDGSAGTVSDSMGPLRRLGINAQTGAYTVTTTDAGKLIRINNTGNITIPTGLSPGDMVSIVSHHNSTNTIVQDTGLTMYNTADGSTGNRTLAARGVCTILWSHTDTAYISGSGLS